MEINRIKQISKLTEAMKDDGVDLFGPLLSYDEEVILSFKSSIDKVLLTNKRIIIIHTENENNEYTFLFYSRMAAFSIETKNPEDIPSELKIWIIGLGEILFSFKNNINTIQIAELIASHIK